MVAGLVVVHVVGGAVCSGDTGEGQVRTQVGLLARRWRSATFLQLDLAAVGGPEAVLPLLLPGRSVLIFGGCSSDDAGLFDPELVNLRGWTAGPELQEHLRRRWRVEVLAVTAGLTCLQVLVPMSRAMAQKLS